MSNEALTKALGPQMLAENTKIQYTDLENKHGKGRWYIPADPEHGINKDSINYQLLGATIVDKKGLNRNAGGITDAEGNYISESDLFRFLREEILPVFPDHPDYANKGFRSLLDAIPGGEADISEEDMGAPMVDAFMQAISTRRYEPIPTGLAPLDNMLGGGLLRQTIVMLGAAPGMGKSFFAQQLFEGMAQQGHNVVYYNLEMGRDQMLARSFARLARTRENSRMTALDVLQGYRWTDEQRAIVKRTAAAYAAEIAPHMSYNPGGNNSQLSVILEQMDRAARRAREAGQEAPLVCIDYLHLLRGDQREDVQTTVKRAMEAFKAYAIRYNSIVFVILAFNRDSNKLGKVQQESGRDSSAIEYSADLMLGLNYTKVEDNTESELVEKVRQAAEQEGNETGHTDYKLKILKNRIQGTKGDFNLMFYGTYGLFIPKDNKSKFQEVDEDLPESFRQTSYAEWKKQQKKK